DAVSGEVTENGFLTAVHLPELVRPATPLAERVKVSHLRFRVSPSELDRGLPSPKDDEGVGEFIRSALPRGIEICLGVPSPGTRRVVREEIQIHSRETKVVRDFACSRPPSS